MTDHALRQVIAACDHAITHGDFDILMGYYAEDAALVIQPGHVVRGKDRIRQAFVTIAAHFQHQLTVTPGVMEVLEGAGTALVIMQTGLRYPDPANPGAWCSVTRRATYVFRLEADGHWRCTVDNSYGTDLLPAT